MNAELLAKAHSLEARNVETRYILRQCTTLTPEFIAKVERQMELRKQEAQMYRTLAAQA